jgi:hypothetical protein
MTEHNNGSEARSQDKQIRHAIQHYPMSSPVPQEVENQIINSLARIEGAVNAKEDVGEIRRQEYAKLSALIAEARITTLEDLLTDYRGNEEAGYIASKGWFIKRINDELAQLRGESNAKL